MSEPVDVILQAARAMDPNLGFDAAPVAMQESLLWWAGNLAKAGLLADGTAQARIDAALAELDRCAIEGYWSGTLVERIRAALIGEERAS